MHISVHSIRKLATAIGLAASLATLVAPAAQADPAKHAHDYLAAPKRTQGYRLITDTLSGNGHADLAPAQGYRFISDTLAPGGGAVLAGSATASSGFDWSDAGIGAAATLALLLMLAGCRAVFRRRRQPAY
jgi:hypothetical protein